MRGQGGAGRRVGQCVSIKGGGGDTCLLKDVLDVCDAIRRGKVSWLRGAGQGDLKFDAVVFTWATGPVAPILRPNKIQMRIQYALMGLNSPHY